MSKIVFFGTGPVASASLESLINDFGIEFVITKAAPKHHHEPAPVEVFARAHGIPIKYANSKDELDKVIGETEIESQIGVVVDYGVIISQNVIGSFPLGIVNSHFSRLPEWRGADPISFAILSGQKTTGVSLMIIRPELDTGKLIIQKPVSISSNETIITLTEKLVNFSNQLLREYLPRYIDGQIQPSEQSNPEQATYSRKLLKSDGLLDPSTMTAKECERKIRAFLGFPKTRLDFLGAETIVTKAKVLDDFAGENWPDVIRCANNTALQIKEIVSPKSGKTMLVSDFLRGRR